MYVAFSVHLEFASMRLPFLWWSHDQVTSLGYWGTTKGTVVLCWQILHINLKKAGYNIYLINDSPHMSLIRCWEQLSGNLKTQRLLETEAPLKIVNHKLQSSNTHYLHFGPTPKMYQNLHISPGMAVANYNTQHILIAIQFVFS